MAKLEHMAPALLLKAKYRFDTRLLEEGVRSYMYCISNIKMMASVAQEDGWIETNSTGNVSLSREVNICHFYLAKLLTRVFSRKER